MTKRKRLTERLPMRKSKCDEQNEVHDIAGVDDNESPFVRNAANARERARMRVLSRAFAKLKTALPWVPPDTKLSKLDTLRLASYYIAHLKGLLDNGRCEVIHSSGLNSIHVQLMKLNWPFSCGPNLRQTPKSRSTLQNKSQTAKVKKTD
ncbi:transcription factor 21-like [Tubulanus polymorphus]|uniref:transcription factor 21-like n=1 Tax=Tubulanus polymorphus TaxID=672921 RepID=UPI003DA40609